MSTTDIDMAGSGNPTYCSGNRPTFQCRVVVFDLDGTLIDTVPDLAAAVDQTLLDLSLQPVGEARVRTWVGNGATKLMERALRHAAGESSVAVQQALDLFFDHYGTELWARSKLCPGVAETLPRLVTRGLHLAVCTNKPTRFVKPLLKHFGIDRFFPVFLGGDDLPVKKPDPSPLLHLAEQLGVSAVNCLVVGDSSNDVEAARAAGMAVAAVSYGYNYCENLGDCDPDVVVDTISELLDLIV